MVSEEKLKDVEKQEPVKVEEDDLEKVKVKKPRMYCNIYNGVNCALSPVVLAGVNASLVAFYGIFSCMFIIGWINLNSCPANIMIPIYLIVAGN